MKNAFARLSFLVSLAGSGLLSCSSGPDDVFGGGDVSGGETVGTVHEELVPSRGLFPYPKKTRSPFQIVLDAQGKPSVGWTGSLTDLMAADAHAMCSDGTPTAYKIEANSDPYIRHIHDKMIATHGLGSTAIVHQLWFTFRKNVRYNFDTSSGLDQAVVFPAHTNADYVLFAAGLPAGTNQAAADAAQFEAYRAEINLCMAQYLRETANSTKGLLLSAADQRELLAVIRDRAQVAMLQYTLLGLSFNSTDTSSDASTSPLQIVGPLHAWAALPASANALARMGADFSAAIRLHAEATRELTEVFLRSASARLPIPGNDPDNLAVEEFGVDSWRNRILNLMYGGDPLRGGSKLWQTYDGHDFGNNVGFGYIQEDLSAPQIQTLIGLARKANAFYLREAIVDDEVDIHIEDSTTRIYRTVEASLRHPECINGTGEAISPCVLAPANVGVPTLANFTQSFLWRRHGVSPDHARTLVQALRRAMPRLCADPAVCPTPKGDLGVAHLTGTHHALLASNPPAGFHTGAEIPGGSGQKWYHLDPSFAFVPRLLGELLGGQLQGIHVPLDMKKLSAAQSQGFSRGRTTPMLTMGAVSALVATRDAILTMGTGATPALTGFLALPRSAVKVISAAVGNRSISLRPKLSHRTVACTQYDPATATCRQATQTSVDGIPSWAAVVTIAEPDASPKIVAVNTHLHELAGSMGLAPGSQYFPTAAPPCTLTPKSFNARDSRGLGLAHLTVNTVPAIDSLNMSVFLVGSCSVTAPPQLSMRVELPRAPIAGTSEYFLPNAHFFAEGGVLGELATRAFTVKNYDWSRPALDAFGLPLDYVPPVDPNLLGNSPDPLEHYLGLAETEARNATNQTKTAIEALMLQDADNVTADTARREGAALVRNENTALCNSTTCDVQTTDVNVTTTLGTAARISRDRSGLVRLAVKQLPSRVTVLKPVADKVNDATPPSFVTNYGQSDLRAVADTQWAALRRARDHLDQAEASGVAAMAQLDDAERQFDDATADEVDARETVAERDAAFQAAGLRHNAAWTTYNAAVTASEAVVVEATRKIDQECGPDALSAAVQAGVGVSCGDTDVTLIQAEGVTHFHCDVRGRSHNSAPYQNQIKICEDAKGALAVAEAQAQATLENRPNDQDSNAVRLALIDAKMAANAALRNIGAAQARLASISASRAENARQIVTRASEIAGVLRTAEGDAGRAVQKTKLNTSRVQLSTDTTDARLTTRFGVFQRYHSADVERARKAILVARKWAVQARRALEERFVIDSSTMTANEFTVDPPATWADAIYDTDLDLLKLTGLNVSATAGANGSHTTGPLDAEKITSYVSNLRRLRNDFFISRPTLAARNDVELISFPGPGAVVETELNGEFVTRLAPEAMKWSFFCSETNRWVAHPGALNDNPASLATVCGSARPARARFVFTLDPWGRLTGDIASPPPAPLFRHNARWTRLALNLVGSGILNCGSDISCQEQESVRFNLQHLTPAWITDRDQNWRILGFPVGRIEGGKAAAAGLFLTAVTNSWNLPEIANIVRQEYDERPLGGAYQLEFEAGPQVILERIERVQVLTQLDYWVRTQ